MKKATSFRLSEEALDIIAKKAAELGLSQASVLELFVRENGPSDQKRNAERRDQAWQRFKDREGGSPDPQTAFRAGYVAGWSLFQTRHSPDPKIRSLFGMKSSKLKSV